ncbi:MAG: hypothetical protein ACRC0J_00720 [Shewanella oncorhynchi]
MMKIMPIWSYSLKQHWIVGIRLSQGVGWLAMVVYLPWVSEMGGGQEIQDIADAGSGVNPTKKASRGGAIVCPISIIRFGDHRQGKLGFEAYGANGLLCFKFRMLKRHTQTAALLFYVK